MTLLILLIMHFCNTRLGLNVECTTFESLENGGFVEKQKDWENTAAVFNPCFIRNMSHTFTFTVFFYDTHAFNEYAEALYLLFVVIIRKSVS